MLPSDCNSRLQRIVSNITSWVLMLESYHENRIKTHIETLKPSLEGCQVPMTCTFALVFLASKEESIVKKCRPMNKDRTVSIVSEGFSNVIQFHRRAKLKILNLCCIVSRNHWKITYVNLQHTDRKYGLNFFEFSEKISILWESLQSTRSLKTLLIHSFLEVVRIAINFYES